MDIKSAIGVTNRSNHEQYVIIDGARHSLLPHETRVVEKHLADAFCSACYPHVSREETVNAVEIDHSMTERVWLYNTTGHPDAPKTINLPRMTKNGRMYEDVPNPKAKALVLKHEFDGGQQQVGDTCLNLGPRIIEIRPYSRKEFDKITADMLLSRDAGQGIEMRGCLATARRPQIFEPDTTWDYLDIQVYGQIIDSKLNIGPTEKKLYNDWSKGKYGTLTFEKVLNDAKEDTLRRVFFLVADPNVKLPTKEEFNSVLAKTKEMMEKVSATKAKNAAEAEA